MHWLKNLPNVLLDIVNKLIQRISLVINRLSFSSNSRNLRKNCDQQIKEYRQFLVIRCETSLLSLHSSNKRRRIKRAPEFKATLFAVIKQELLNSSN